MNVDFAIEMLAGARVFVTTRERIKHPEGTELFDEAIRVLREHLADRHGAGDAEDSARLDWVIEQHATLFTDGAGLWHVAYEYTIPVTHGPMADSPRAAIDAARAGERG